MQEWYGCRVYQTDQRTWLDWGQALARGVYGEDWREEGDLDIVPGAAVTLAEQWEDKKNWPDWINRVF